MVKAERVTHSRCHIYEEYMTIKDSGMGFQVSLVDGVLVVLFFGLQSRKHRAHTVRFFAQHLSLSPL